MTETANRHGADTFSRFLGVATGYESHEGFTGAFSRRGARDAQSRPQVWWSLTRSPARRSIGNMSPQGAKK